VTDTVQRFVLVLDVPNGRSYRIGDGEGPTALVSPWARCRRAGRIYVADISQRQVVVYDPFGGLIKKIGGEKVFDRLTSVTVNPEGTLIYAVDIGGVDSDKHVVKGVRRGDRRPQDGYRKRGVGPASSTCRATWR